MSKSKDHTQQSIVIDIVTLICLLCFTLLYFAFEIPTPHDHKFVGATAARNGPLKISLCDHHHHRVGLTYFIFGLGGPHSVHKTSIEQMLYQPLRPFNAENRQPAPGFRGSSPTNHKLPTVPRPISNGPRHAIMMRTTAAGRAAVAPAPPPPAAAAAGASPYSNSPGNPKKMMTTTTRTRRSMRDRGRRALRRGAQQLRGALIGEMPSSLSLRTKVRITLEVRARLRGGGAG
jgi:hypothetical protein